MNYETFEDDIVAQIVAWCAADGGVAVDAMPLPDSVKDYQLAYDKPVIFVCYQKSGYSAPKSIGVIVQQQMPEVTVMVESRKRRGAGGICDTLERVRLALMNFRPQHCTALYAKDDKFAEYKDQTWSYEFCFTCATMAVSYVPIPSDPPANPPQQQNTDPEFN